MRKRQQKEDILDGHILRFHRLLGLELTHESADELRKIRRERGLPVEGLPIRPIQSEAISQRFTDFARPDSASDSAATSTSESRFRRLYSEKLILNAILVILASNRPQSGELVAQIVQRSRSYVNVVIRRLKKQGKLPPGWNPRRSTSRSQEMTYR